MSADNWTICPRCKAKHDEETASRLAAVAQSYGKVSPSEYIASLEAANKESPLEDSLREDYELSMGEDGYIFISYRCSCNCGFAYNFKHEEGVNIS